MMTAVRLDVTATADVTLMVLRFGPPRTRIVLYIARGSRASATT
jgi:hypothetical protein